MMRKKIYELMDMFPYFFDKSESSNFFKSQSVTNNQLLKVYQSLMEVKDSLRLDKKCLIWKEQSVPYEYTINFLVNYPLLKSVKCYKNDTLIYSEEYLEEDNISSFNYSYDSSDDIEVTEDTPIIPEDTFHIIVETYEEYLIQKGFPENDTIQGDMYDHDESLDEIGALNGVQRKTYKSTEDYAHTEPPYNNRLSEDDYHYMNRIIEYNLKLHNTSLPVLEIWKEYGIFSDMINREEYLLKMFDEHMHPYDEETGLVGDWTPMPWEHKDRLCELTSDNGRFFFVSANTLIPVKNQNVIFSFQFLNSLAEKLTGDYSVTISLVGDEEDTVLVENYTGEQYTVTSDIISDDQVNIFKFEAYEGPTIFETETIEIIVRGCNTGNWYVSPNGDDSNTGKSINSPFATIDKAVSMVSGEENLIILMSGTHSIDHAINIPVSCIILGCGGATISNSTNLRFFKIYQNQSMNLQDVSLSFGNYTVAAGNDNFINNNKSNTPLYVILQEPPGGLILTASASYVKSGDEITITVTLNDEDGEPVEGADIELYKVTT